jgi:primosomal protein N'
MSNWPFKLDHVQSWAYWKNAFSKEECNLIVKLGKKNLITGHVIDPKKTKNYRKSKINWIQPNEETDWIFKRLTDISESLNDQFFKFDVLHEVTPVIKGERNCLVAWISGKNFK